MMRASPFACALLSTILAPRAVRAQPAPRPLTLAEAQQLAVAHSPELAAAGSRLDAADDVRRAARGAFLPKVDASGSALYWNSPFAIAFGAFPPITAREQSTLQATVQATQPITGLYGIGESYAAQSAGADAARSDLDAARSDLQLRVTQAYVQWLLAQRLAEVAAAAVKAAQGHLDVAMASERAGVLSKLDVARAETAVSRARQTLITTTAQVETAKTALALLAGVDPSIPLLADATPFPDPPPAFAMTIDEAEARALERRPELKALKSLRAAAGSQAKAAWWELVPQIAATAAYQYSHGFPFAMPKNQEFAGAVLSWNVWDWGQTLYKARAASAAETQADARLASLRDAMYLDVKRQILDVNAAYQAIEVGRTAVGAAATAQQFETDRYKQGVATTTDVLDSDTELENAQATYAQALYNYYLARAQLERAMGG